MIQELISTSAPRCLDGQAGFGAVAQTAGMAPNVCQAVHALSGYTHIAAPGSTKNPVIYLHVTRKTAGVLRHIVSRIADCGNDYSGRSNRIAHHWIVEEEDVRSLPGGPAELTAQNIFRSHWQDKPTELSPKKLSLADVSPEKCIVWEQLTGDAGWGGIVAERAEKGNPISIIFSPEHNGENLRTLIGESLALLPSWVRWKITFSTYYMKSHEASGDAIQIKCFLADSEESQFVRQSPNTVVLDLRQRLGTAPTGKYVEWARGTVKPPPRVQSDTNIPADVSAPSLSQVHKALQQMAFKKSQVTEEVPMPDLPVMESTANQNYAPPKKTWLKEKSWLLPYLMLGVIVIQAGCLWWYVRTHQDPTEEYNELVARVGKLNKTVQTLTGSENEDSDPIELRDKIKQLETANTELKSSLEQSKADIEKLAKDQTNLEEDVEKLNMRIAKLEKSQQGSDDGKQDEQGPDTKSGDGYEDGADTSGQPAGSPATTPPSDNKVNIDELIKKLPRKWPIALPSNQQQDKPLDSSQFLYDLRQNGKGYTIELDGVNKLTQSTINVQKAGPSVKIHNKSTRPGTFALDAQLATIKLDQDGLQFEWYPVLPKTLNQEQKNILHQILQLELYITISNPNSVGESYTHTITLQPKQ